MDSAERGLDAALVKPSENNNVLAALPDDIDDRAYDPVKSITKKKEIWRLGVIVDDMWSVYKGDAEDHIELLVRDIKVVPFTFDAFMLLHNYSYNLNLHSQ
jgi:hypothetical protein